MQTNELPELPEVLGIGELADSLGCQGWRIQRLIELGVLDDFPRVGGRRVITRGRIQEIKAALIERGWLS